MRILFLCHRLPYPPQRGGKIRPFNIIRHLSAQGHEVTVCSLARSPAEAAAGEGLARYCSEMLIETIGAGTARWRMAVRLPTPVPSSFGYFHAPALRRRIRELLQRRSFDLVFAHCSSAAQYVEELGGLPKVLDFGDMDSQKWRAYASCYRFPAAAGYWLEAVKLERREAAQAASSDLCTCTTRAELQYLDGLQVARRTGWFPNGVDLDYFAPAAEAYDPDVMVFVGRMDYFPNQQGVLGFCRDVLPLLHTVRPRLRLRIVGAEPPRRIRALAALPGVDVTGSVEDVRPFVRGAALTLAPLSIARGTQNKILESLAMGVPVVASHAAAGGVDAVAGEHLLVAQTSEEYREAIIALTTNAARRTQLGEAGRARMLERHYWPASMARLDGLLRLGVTPTVGLEAA